jgi:hypothetical protein
VAPVAFAAHPARERARFFRVACCARKRRLVFAAAALGGSGVAVAVAADLLIRLVVVGGSVGMVGIAVVADFAAAAPVAAVAAVSSVSSFLLDDNVVVVVHRINEAVHESVVRHIPSLCAPPACGVVCWSVAAAQEGARGLLERGRAAAAALATLAALVAAA